MEKITLKTKFNNEELKKAKDLGITIPTELEEFINQPFCTDLLATTSKNEVVNFFKEKYPGISRFPDLYIYKIKSLSVVDGLISILGETFFPEKGDFLRIPFLKTTILSKKVNLDSNLEVPTMYRKKLIIDEEEIKLIKEKSELLFKNIDDEEDYDEENDIAHDENEDEVSKALSGKKFDSKSDAEDFLSKKFKGFYFVSNMLYSASLQDLVQVCKEELSVLNELKENSLRKYPLNERSDEIKKEIDKKINTFIQDQIQHFDIFTIDKMFFDRDPSTGKEILLVEFSEKWWFKDSIVAETLKDGIPLKYGKVLNFQDSKLNEIKDKLINLHSEIDKILEELDLNTISRTNVEDSNIKTFEELKKLKTESFENLLTNEDKDLITNLNKIKIKVDAITKNFEEFQQYSLSKGQPFEMPSIKEIYDLAVKQLEKENKAPLNKKSSLKIKLKIGKT